MLRNEKGFTLLEIIAVLVILGILAAVAVPRYISLLDESRNSSAQAAIAEVKARATGYYAINTLRNGAVPPLTSVFNSVTATPDLGNDFGVTAGQVASGISISVGTVKNVAITAIVGTWFYPTP
jgi:MSHA pilin protein MshA